MRLVIFLLLAMTYSNLIAQFNRIDKGNGHYKNLTVATTAIKLIEKGDVGRLYKYFAPTFKIDSSNLKINCDYVSNQFPYNDSEYPMSFNDNVGKILWYSRTYYKKNDNKIEYLYQLFIKLERFNGEIKITELQFRTKDKVEDRDKEIEALNREVDEDNPPLAPPPPPTNE